MKPSIIVVAMAAWALLLAGCASEAPWARYELCFGMSADSGRTQITEQQWQQFRDTEIAPRFPDGFSIIRGDGYWRNNATNYSEPSQILMVVAPADDSTRAKLDAIANAYSRRFIQDSVLEIKSPATLEFHRYP